MSLNQLKTIIACLLLFKDNWTKANEARGATGAIILPGAYTLAGFITVIAAIQAILLQTQELFTLLRLAYAERATIRSNLLNTISRFHYGVKNHLSEIDRARLVKIPRNGTTHLDFLLACDATRSLWQYLLDNPIAELPAPLTIDGVTLEDFTASMEELTVAYENTITKRNAAKAIIQARRQMLNQAIKPRLRQYRDAIISVFPRQHEVRVNLPTYATTNGPAADLVTLSGGWDEQTRMASLSWTPSAVSALLHYEIRACQGAIYSTDEEVQLATVPGDQTTWQSNEELYADGSSLTYRVYVVTKMHRERGSNTLKVTRPEAPPISQAA